MAAKAKKRNTTKRTNTNYKKNISPGKNASSSPIIAVIGSIVAIFLGISNFGLLGPVGNALKYVQFGLFGWCGYLFPFLLLAVVLYLGISKIRDKVSVIFAVVLFLAIGALVHLSSGLSLAKPILSYFNDGARESIGGGIISGAIAAGLNIAISRTGAYIFIIALIFLSFFLIFRKPIIQFVKDINDSGDSVQKIQPASQKAKRSSNAFACDEPENTNIRKVNKKEKTVYETTDGERVIRIVSTRSRVRKKKRTPADLVRSNNKTASMRSGVTQNTAIGAKIAKGVASDTSVINSKADSDEICEITRKNKKEKRSSGGIVIPTVGGEAVYTPGYKEKAEGSYAAGESSDSHKGANDSVFRSRELTVSNEKPGQSVLKVGPVVNESREAETKKKQLSWEDAISDAKYDIDEDTEVINGDVQTQNYHPSGRNFEKKVQSSHSDIEEPKQRAALSGTVLSKGEPVRTFTPVETVKGAGADRFVLPPGEKILSKPRTIQSSQGDIRGIAEKLVNVLGTFGVNVELTDIQVGPSVTRFELKPELGTRVSKITSLADDLKLNLAVTEMRIEAPIPGKAAIGIEIPNKSRQTVTLRELLESREIREHKSKIAFSAGKDISGNVIACDLAKMPHMLVAGTTGSGKSVFLNSILMCILYRAKPTEVGLIIVDPKKVEFGVYKGIPHLMKDVVTDPGQAVSTLRWAVGEMTNRYQRMQMSGVRDFKTYNEKFDRGELSSEETDPKRMQQIVIVIDELADLMMVAAKEVESLICRLAQLARAAGIHLIIATQRPSVDVVTGLIKANIPARVALLVASAVDSRTIIDMGGAEKLLGNGDMLFYPTGYVKPIRVQGAYVSDQEIQDTVKYLCRQGQGFNYYEKEAKEMEAYASAPVSGSGTGADGSDSDGDDAGKYDEYLYDAGMLCIESGKASSSMLQRRFSVGFNRAARIVDQLYDIGAIGPQNGAKPREIIVDSMKFEELCDELGIRPKE